MVILVLINSWSIEWIEAVSYTHLDVYKRQLQDYPADYNYNNEQNRFEEAGRLWKQAAKPGSEKWNHVMNELLKLDFTLDPTFNIYDANRDFMRARQADWHKIYTLPSLWKFEKKAIEAVSYTHLDVYKRQQ